ncbi:hypothetical protein [Enterococcus casseliflavus]|uniref:hypothetical protein n=2 Tax=Enterococcus casseliflavus TaxID=37734 RepID=UPI0022E89D84|nr:hypothetical protein [Enterococcus casseliflavus]
MSKDLKKVYSITVIQVVIYVIAFAMAFLNRGISPNWPFYLVLVGILGGFFIPQKYRSQFSSTAPGIFFKEPYETYRKYNRTDRHLFRHFSGYLFKYCLEGV